MINIEKFSYDFPEKELYKNITLTVEDGQHVAFIGGSGSGKSTLLEIIRNQEEYLYDGKLTIENIGRIGYVSQFTNMNDKEEMTVFEYISEPFTLLQEELADICVAMENSPEKIEELLEDYQVKLDESSAIGGDDFESNIEKKLHIANLKHQRDLKVSQLSGGELKLIQIIKEMLISPNLVMMDEPDVFLDFDNLKSLKNIINSYKGTLIIITHNRYLLNHCFNKIIHLENKLIQEFDGNFREYNLSLMETKIELQELSIADDKEIERNEAMIKKLRAIATNNAEASRGRSLKARVKIQERLMKRRIQAPFVDIKQPKIFLDTINELEEEIVLAVKDYSVSFEESLLENVNFEIKSNEKVAFVGLNGTGKTTLLRDIYKNNHPNIKINPNVKVEYLSQIQGEKLDESKTILDEFMDQGFNTITEATEFLKDFGFSENVLNQKIGQLSGGEKNILQLAKIAYHKADFLLLDEPTSHLDMYGQLALEKALKDYKGTILMISHDFYTITKCMDYILLIEDKKIRRLSMRKFRKMVYGEYFDKDYLLIEDEKTKIETKIAIALKEKKYEEAKELLELLYSKNI